MRPGPVVLGSLVLLAAAAAPPCAAQSAAWGEIGVNDTLVYDVFVVRTWKLFSIVNEWTQYPPDGVILENPRLITAIRAWDKGKRATASITSGGVCHSSVRMKFTSRRNKGIRFQVQVWTKPSGSN